MRTVQATVTVSIWNGDECSFECTSTDKVEECGTSLGTDVEVAIFRAWMSVESAIRATHRV